MGVTSPWNKDKTYRTKLNIADDAAATDSGVDSSLSRSIIVILVVAGIFLFFATLVCDIVTVSITVMTGAVALNSRIIAAPTIVTTTSFATSGVVPARHCHFARPSINCSL